MIHGLVQVAMPSPDETEAYMGHGSAHGSVGGAIRPSAVAMTSRAATSRHEAHIDRVVHLGQTPIDRAGYGQDPRWLG